MADSINVAISWGASGGKKTSLIKQGATPELQCSPLILFGKTLSIISLREFLIRSRVTGSGFYGASAHLIGFGGGSSFFLWGGFFTYFFFFFLSFSSSGLGICLPNKILGSLYGLGFTWSTYGLGGIGGNKPSSSFKI